MIRVILLSIVSLFVSVASAQVSDATLTTQANVIRNETAPSGNTRGRVADMFQAIIDSKPSLLGTYSNPSWISTLGWSKITGTPTTLSGYGITDAVPSSRSLTINGTSLDLSANRSWSVGDVVTSGSYADPSWITSLNWSKITSRPTTLSGYGITDAWSLASGGTLTGNNSINTGTHFLDFTSAGTTTDIRINNTGGAASNSAQLRLQGSNGQTATITVPRGGDPTFNISAGGLDNPVFINLTHGINSSAIVNALSTTPANSRLHLRTNSVTRTAYTTTDIQHTLPTIFGTGTITASTQVDIHGTGTSTNNAFRIADNTNVQRLLVQDRGNVVIGTGALTNANTILDIQSTTQGIAPPRMTTAERDAISSPYSGLFVYNTSTNALNFHNGTSWGAVGGGGGGISNTAANNELMKSDGTDAIPSGLFSALDGNLTLGGSSTSGATRTFTTNGSSANISLIVSTKGSGQLSFLGDGSTMFNISQNRIAFFGETPVVKQSAVTTAQGIADALVAYGLLPSSTISSGGTYYAPSTLVANATDANFTATLNGVHNILDGVASANRVITIPTGSNGDVMKFYNTEDTRVWSFTGATVYLADRVTVVTELLYNVPCHMERIDGRWIITN